MSVKLTKVNGKDVLRSLLAFCPSLGKSLLRQYAAETVGQNFRLYFQTGDKKDFVDAVKPDFTTTSGQRPPAYNNHLFGVPFYII